jgi:hypothetical protein
LNNLDITNYSNISNFSFENNLSINTWSNLNLLEILINYESQKEIYSEIDNNYKKLNKLKIEFEKKINNLKNKSLSSSQNKESSKRTFKEASVPTILCKFLNLEENVLLSRPKVLSIFTQKLKDLKLKEGSKITFDSNILKELKLDLNLIKSSIEE